MPGLAYHKPMIDSPIPPPSAEPSGNGDASLALEHLVQRLMAATEACLRQSGTLSELELIRQLQAPPWELIGRVDYADPAALYPVHFLIYHTLYRLRDELATDCETISLSPLAISLTSTDVVAGTGLPDHADPLRDFYLDLSQYHMAAEEVLRMVDDFFAGRVSARPADSEAEQAAVVLGFESLPARFDEVKYRFRRAVMQAHPDRGGSTAEVQQVNQAFAVLRHYFRQGDVR